jgi:hypothetical protein
MERLLRAAIKLAMDAQYSDEAIVKLLHKLEIEVRRKIFIFESLKRDSLFQGKEW